MHHSSLHRMKRFVDLYLGAKRNEKLHILDFGSQVITGESYRKFFTNPNWIYTGVDICAGPNVDCVLKDKYKWKEIPDNGVDVFISGQAFEHIEYIWLSMLEIGRVLKPGGITCLLAPSAVGLIHRYPVDCWRIQADGWKALAKYANLEPIICQTKWEQLPAWVDGSNIWDDCVLIAKKPS